MVKIIILGNSWWILTPFLEVNFNLWRNKNKSDDPLDEISTNPGSLKTILNFRSKSHFSPRKYVTPMMVKIVTKTATSARSGHTLRKKKLSPVCEVRIRSQIPNLLPTTRENTSKPPNHFSPKNKPPTDTFPMRRPISLRLCAPKTPSKQWSLKINI